MTRPAPPPAELDRRFYAFAVDRLVAWTTDVALVYAVLRPVGRDHPVTGALTIAGVVLLVGAVLAVIAGLTGTSPGRAAVRIRLVDAVTGDPIGVGRALRRQLVLGLATLPTFGLGVVVLAWTAVTDPGGRRRGWHDRIAGSAVVDARTPSARPVPDEPAPPGMVNLTAMRLVPAPPPPAGSAPPPSPAARPVPGRPPAPAVPTGRWRVAFDTGESVVVEGLTLLGREPEARPGETVRRLVTLRSADLSLSKTHAQLQLGADGVLLVADRGSTNGSVLVREGATRDLPPGRSTTLLEGDVVRLGDREMRVSRDPGPGSTDP